jgi:hypothetical protein
MLQEDCFYEAPNKSLIYKQIIDIASNNEPWGLYYNFLTKVVGQEIIEQDKFLKDLHMAHNFTALVFKIMPHSVYNWHVDTKRLCSLNMLLNTEDISHCLFSNAYNSITFDVLELKYKPETYYAFNTKEPHSVINLDKPRYVFSLEFNDSSFTYKDLVSYIKNDLLNKS